MGSLWDVLRAKLSSKDNNRPVSEIKMYPDEVNPGNACVVHLHKTFFNSAFFLGLTPFGMRDSDKKNSTNNKASIEQRSFAPHIAICMILTVLDILWIVRDIRLSSVPPKTREPQLYFMGAKSWISSFHKLVLIKKLWFNHKDFLDIVNYISKSGGENLPRVKQSWWKGKTVNFLTILFYIGIAIIFCSKGGVIILVSKHVNIFSWSWWWERMVEAGRYNFFTTNNPANIATLIVADANETRVESFSHTDNFLGVLAMMGLVHRLWKKNTSTINLMHAGLVKNLFSSSVI